MSSAGQVLTRTNSCFGLCAALALSGCASVEYYAQSVTGHLGLMAKARPVETVIEAPDTASGLAVRLRTALEIQEFASDVLALPANASYRRYVDLGRRYVVRTVVAAPELSLEPRRWCFPVAGCVSYRGYFSGSDADAYAAKLESEGWDVTVSGVRAYSTLGWFADPLLSSMVELPEYALAGLIFHELAHQRLYVPGDTDFNESFAVVVERAGVRHWLEATDRSDLRDRYRVAAERRAAFLGLVRDTRRGLEAVYASSGTDAEKRAAKMRAFERLRSQYDALRATWTSGPTYDFWFERGVNNAALALVVAYDRWVPALEALLAGHDRDLEAFYRACDKLAALTPEERRARLEALDPLARTGVPVGGRQWTTRHTSGSDPARSAPTPVGSEHAPDIAPNGHS
ncbi:MAG: aminopeptidase [Thiotrichales bacterium]|nr:aminopeptidase [Thiotrichales bacterium]